MVATQIKHTLLDLERQYWDALKKRDGETAARLTYENGIATGPQGIMQLNKQAVKEMAGQDTFVLKDYKIDTGAAKTLQVNDDLAVLAYPVHEEATMNGKPITLDAYELSVWVRTDGRWECPAHTETLAQKM